MPKQSVPTSFCLAGLLTGWLALPAPALGQLNLPQVVQLPTEDFVFSWGETRPIDSRDRPQFTVRGVEAAFHCTATGTFKPGSRMSDYYNMREFEQSLSGSIYFIQNTTSVLNNLYLSNDLQWASLNCIIPQAIESEDKTQERIDKALERAERDRERRREREARDAD